MHGVETVLFLVVLGTVVAASAGRLRVPAPSLLVIGGLCFQARGDWRFPGNVAVSWRTVAGLAASPLLRHRDDLGLAGPERCRMLVRSAETFAVG